MRDPFYELSSKYWILVKPPSDGGGAPEEHVRQWCLHELVRAHGISATKLQIERPVRVGTRTHRADIVVLQGSHPYIVIECKARQTCRHEEGMNQAISYANAAEMNAEFAVYTNGEVWLVQRRVDNQWVPVSDIPTFRNGSPSTNLRDILLAVKLIGPLLYWLDKTIPPRQAPKFFLALQRFLHGANQITADTDRLLLHAADRILRVLCDAKSHPSYTDGNMAKACDYLNRYWQERGVETAFGGDNMWDSAHHSWAELSNMLVDTHTLPVTDERIMKIMLSLLDYLNSMKGKRGKYEPVGPSIQSEIRNYLNLALKTRFNAQLPETQDTIFVQDIRNFCQPLWDAQMKL